MTQKELDAVFEIAMTIWESQTLHDMTREEIMEWTAKQLADSTHNYTVPVGASWGSLTTKGHYEDYYFPKSKRKKKYKKTEVFKVYTTRNLADTTRDPDEIQTNDIGLRYTLADAKELANKYIKKNFFHTDTKLYKLKGGKYTATDVASYGETIIIEPVKIM